MVHNIVSRAMVDALAGGLNNAEGEIHLKDMEVDELARTTSLGQ